MSKSLVPRKDAGSGVVDSVVSDGATVAITAGTIIAYAALPVFGWVALLAGGGWLTIRAVKKGLKNR